MHVKKQQDITWNQEESPSIKIKLKCTDIRISRQRYWNSSYTPYVQEHDEKINKRYKRVWDCTFRDEEYNIWDKNRLNGIRNCRR